MQADLKQKDAVEATTPDPLPSVESVIEVACASVYCATSFRMVSHGSGQSVDMAGQALTRNLRSIMLTSSMAVDRYDIEGMSYETRLPTHLASSAPGGPQQVTYKSYVRQAPGTMGELFESMMSGLALTSQNSTAAWATQGDREVVVITKSDPPAISVAFTADAEHLPVQIRYGEDQVTWFTSWGEVPVFSAPPRESDDRQPGGHWSGIGETNGPIAEVDPAQDSRLV
ncbi:hypothetical protein [Luteipulveratus mongoliensis]|uniref:Uncharacterized protein n=1 Tax=Luteipulveratus mongoliensis TaxID=571913 RepID=A0A0K1JDM0_9MICO|nr:hypothetical protein [Luteipulveratus mongoliensis]AKU14796.1 hypothetical protein VV02_01110 [Luteipulveratus mongoliensis]